MNKGIEEIRSRILYIFNYLEEFVLLNASIGFILGIVVAEVVMGINSSVVLMIGVTVIMLWRLFGKELHYSFVFLFMISLCFGIFYINRFEEKSIRNVGLLDGYTVQIIGDVVEEADIKSNHVNYVIRPEKIVVFEKDLIIESIKGKFLVSNSIYPKFDFGEKVYIEGRVQVPENFDSFDYQDYLRCRGIYAVINRPDNLEKMGESDGILRLQKVLYSIKLSVKSRIDKIISEPHSSLLLGILLGVESTMPSDFQESLRVTGTTHIIAVSGYNVTVLVAFFLGFAKLFGRKLVLFLSFPLLTIFIFIVGTQNIPVVRAGIMGFMMLISLLTGRKRTVLVLFPLSIVILLLINPLSFKLISFQLSVLSTFGLIGFSEILDKFLPWVKSVEFLKEEFVSTLSAIIFTLPVTIYNFGIFSIIAPLVNLLVLPLIPIAMLLGFVLICLSFLSLGLSRLFGCIVWLPFEYMITIINTFGKVSFASIEVGGWSANIILLVYALLFLIVFEYHYKHENTKYKKN